MDFAKKFILVDLSKVDLPQLSKPSTSNTLAHQNLSEKLMDPHVQELKRLDGEMENIIKDSNLSASEKVLRYNDVLTRFQDSNLKIKDTPINVKLINSPEVNNSKAIQKAGEDKTSSSNEEIKQENSSIRSTLEKLPAPIKDRAGKLVDEWSKHQNISVSENGELMINDKLLEDSNAETLITTLMRCRTNPFNKLKGPKGWKEFMDNIRPLHLPDGVITGWTPKHSALDKKPTGSKSKAGKSSPYSKKSEDRFKKESLTSNWLSFR